MIIFGSQKINILGTEYKIKVKNYNEDSSFKENSISAYCDGILKEIIMCDPKTLPDWDKETDEVCMLYFNETLRHEIIHAFLNESGLKAGSSSLNIPWSKNEEMIDWFAIQSPKIYKIYFELNIL